MRVTPPRCAALSLLLALGLAAAPASARPVKLSHSFEGEAATSYGSKIFNYYRPAKGYRLNASVLRTMRPKLAQRYARPAKSGRKPRKITWATLNDLGKATYLERLFRQQTARKLRGSFFAKYRRDGFPISQRQWAQMTPAQQLKQVTYSNLNQQGRKRFKEIMREVMPLHRTRAVPAAFESILFWESPTTYELRHKGKTGSATKVNQAVHWMKTKISPRVRPHRHVSWKPDLGAITTRRKEFLSFVQRVDLLMFSQRLEKKSAGALFGAYGKNFMPYSASKLAAIDRSMVKRSYSLFLGSKLHGLGLRTYRDGSVGLEVRAVTDAAQLKWYADLVSRAVRKGAIGAVKYDQQPIEFKPVGAALASAVGQRLRVSGARVPPRLANWIDGQLRRAGLDHRVSYALQSWERQPFVPRTKHSLVVRQRARFVRQVSTLLAGHAARPLAPDRLRAAVMSAVWEFAGRCRISQDLDRSIQRPLAQPGVRGPSLVRDAG